MRNSVRYANSITAFQSNYAPAFLADNVRSPGALPAATNIFRCAVVKAAASRSSPRVRRAEPCVIRHLIYLLCLKVIAFPYILKGVVQKTFFPK